MAEAGSGLELEFIQKFTDQTLTSICRNCLPCCYYNVTLAAEDDPWYSALKVAFAKHKLQVNEYNLI